MAPEQVEALIRAWESRDPEEWRLDSARHAAFARQAVALGSPGLAFDICADGLACFPSNLEIRYLSALALANSGSSGRASRVLDDLLASDCNDVLRSDALSLAGRVAKERWAKLPDGAGRKAAGDQARSCYQRAFELSRDPFPGINAATMSILARDTAEGHRIASEVGDICNARASRAGADDLWNCATLGEASLLLGETETATRWYQRATAASGRRHGDVASMRRQVKLLSPHVNGASSILEILHVPCAGVFTGHMIDARGREKVRFPASLEPVVAAAIAKAIEEIDLGFGYCSAACGADILFAEQMLARGSEIHIVLPFQREDFVRTSVSFAGDSWVERFERILAKATSVTYCVEESHLGDDVLFAYAAQLTAGLAALRSEQLETELVMLAVAEPEEGALTGGTLSNVQRWKNMGRKAKLLNLRELRKQAPAAGNPSAVAIHRAETQSTKAEGLPWGRRQIRTMLFADMVGYSKLREHETPKFFVNFLSAIEREMDASRNPPVFGNTWGDGLYLVFEEVAHAADFALCLRDAIARIDWQAAGLPPDMDIRVGMHTGPVFRAIDPVIKQENFFGSHVTRAARIEPVAAPGSIYVSEQLAAALAASGDRQFACDYLGALALAKKFGSGRIYRLRRAAEVE